MSQGKSAIAGGQILSHEQIDAVLRACATLKRSAGPLIPIFHAVQEELGFVPHDAVPLIARELNLSIAEVHGVLSFYHFFRDSPGGRHVVHVCRAEACQSVGARAVEAHAKRTLGIDFHGTTTDGAIRLEPVYCLGNCALGPSIMIDDQLHGRVSAQRFDELMRHTRAAAGNARASAASARSASEQKT
jgi:formate dehydrogenase subunit gamma